MMKRALTAIVSVGILAATVVMEPANAQRYRRYGPARTYVPQAYPPQSRRSVPRGVPRTVPFADPNSVAVVLISFVLHGGRDDCRSQAN